MHLEVHTNYSLLEGANTIRQVVSRAVEYGFKWLAITDTGGLYGAIPFYAIAREAGVKPIIGAKLGRAVVLARDREGYAELCRIVTDSHLDPHFDIAAHAGSDHLFVLTADRLLLETLRLRGVHPLVAVTHYGDSQSRYHAARLRDYAHSMCLRPVAVNPAYFLDPEDWQIHRVLAAIRHNAAIDTLESDQLADPREHLRNSEEMSRLYADWPETRENAEWVADHCDLKLALGKPMFPDVELPDGETPFSTLWKLAFDGLRRMYKPLTPEVVRRLHYELDIINRLGFAPYFLIVWDIVQFARANDIPIVGRGSAANSLAAHVLGITRVDPFKYDLYFERFLNMSRTDCPDIDLDICWRRRDDVIDYVYKKYGDDRVAMICTFNTFRARAALRETAKAFGFTEQEVREVVKQVPHYRAHDVRTVVKFLPECRHLRIDEEPLKSILKIAEAIDGYPRHLSIHSGGLVIAPEPLTNYLPLQRATKGILISQYDMHPVEDLGLIKMDLLGHRSLTVIKETVELVRRNRGIEIDVEKLPDPDPLTANLMRDARSIGCFQIESPAMRTLLKSTRADTTDMLIKTLSLVRPGPSGSGMKKRFIERHLGRESVVYLHPSLERVLGDTYGVMLYQEDILKVANVIAGLDLAEGDALRRAMTKKRGPQEMAKNMKHFLERARENGVGETEAEAIWGIIANFAEYSYCKAHASTYGEIAYQCTYLKAHFPAEFLASVLSNRGGFYHPAVYVEEARRFGLEVLPPDVNKSVFNYTVEGEALRMGFVEVRNLTREAVREIMAVRKSGAFISVADLWRRTNIGPADLEVFINSGACDSFKQTRPQMLWELKSLARDRRPKNVGAESMLFARSADLIPVPHLPGQSRKHRSDLEWSTLGMALSTHAIEYYAPTMLGKTLVLSRDLPMYGGRTVNMVGWMIAERRVALKGRGCMKFLTCEDVEGVFEAVLFQETYQRYGHLLTSQGPFFIQGQVQDENGCYSVVCDHIERAGHVLKSPRLSEITPPMRWLLNAVHENITQAD